MCGNEGEVDYTFPEQSEALHVFSFERTSTSIVTVFLPDTVGFITPFPSLYSIAEVVKLSLQAVSSKLRERCVHPHAFDELLQCFAEGAC